MFKCSQIAFKALLLSALFVSFTGLVANADPVVANVTAAQRPDNSRLIDIHYDLASTVPCTVWFVVSANSGTNWNIPAMTYTGAVGPNVAAGLGKAIVWDAGADIPGKVGNFKVRVYADDGQGMNMVLVPGGTFPYQNNGAQQVYVASFLIDKFEVTNQRYCEFLNSADPDGEHWNLSMEISRTGAPPNVTYVVNDGRQNYPVRWVSAIDADAYAAWLSQTTGHEYRLPTEQEWEKAAAWNNTQGIFSDYAVQSNAIDCTRVNFVNVGPNNQSYFCVGNTTEVGHYNGLDGTALSHSFYGCYDLSGNVREWTSTNHPFPGNRMVRGGAWVDHSAACATTNSFGYGVANRTADLGFRVVRPLS